MEAINSGTLAVVSNIPVLKEVYEDSVLYFDTMDTNSIVKALQNVLKISNEDRDKMIKSHKSFLKNTHGKKWQKKL